MACSRTNTTATGFLLPRQLTPYLDSDRLNVIHAAPNPQNNLQTYCIAFYYTHPLSENLNSYDLGVTNANPV